MTQSIFTLQMKKRYYETFKEGLSGVSGETKEIVRLIAEDISDKRLRNQMDEVIGLLGH